jgi:hypothetical protein
MDKRNTREISKILKLPQMCCTQAAGNGIHSDDDGWMPKLRLPFFSSLRCSQKGICTYINWLLVVVYVSRRSSLTETTLLGTNRDNRVAKAGLLSAKKRDMFLFLSTKKTQPGVQRGTFFEHKTLNSKQKEHHEGRKKTCVWRCVWRWHGNPHFRSEPEF